MRKHPLAICENCPLQDERYIPSKIVSDSKYVVIAEAPAYQEAKLGEPLVGQSGKLLNATFRNLGTDPACISKLNAVSCFCEPGKPPSAKAIECCKPRLQAELAETSGPILVLGNSAVRALFGTKGKPSISQLRGTNDTYENRPVVFTYHPAATFRSPNLLRVFEGDIRNLVSDADKLQIEDIDYEYYEGEGEIESLTKQLQTLQGKVSYDIETNYKQWYEPRAKITSLSLSPSSTRSIVIAGDLLYQQAYKDLLNWFFARVKPIAHNAKFDEPYLRSIGINVPTFGDTMLQSNALNEYKQNHGLKELANQYLGIGAYKHLAQTDEVLYNAIDTATTYALHEAQNDMLRRDGTEKVYQMLMEFHWLMSQVEYHGFKLHIAGLKKLEKELEIELDGLAKGLQETVRQSRDTQIDVAKLPIPIAKWIKSDLQYRNAVVRTLFSFNPSSSQHMQILVHDILKLEAVGEWPKGEDYRSTSEDVLNILEQHPVLEEILKYRKHEKILKTYVRKFLAKADPNGYLHPEFIIGGTETGRLSARDAVHSLPRTDTDLGRRLGSNIICENDEIIVVGDLGQAELRIFAVEAKVKFLIQAYQEGKDVHNEVVMKLKDHLTRYLHLDLSNPDHKSFARVKIGKTFNFGSIYGGGIPMLASQTGLPKEIISPIHAEYHKTMPEIKLYALKQMQLVYKQGYVVSRFGRKRRFYNIASFNRYDIQKEAANAPTQGSASDITMHAAIELQKQGFQVIHLMHDGIYAVVKRGEGEIKAKQMRQIMEETAAKFYPEVPWEAETKIGSSFGTLRKVQ